MLADGPVCLPNSSLTQQATLPTISPFDIHFFELNILKGILLKSLLYLHTLLGGEGLVEPCCSSCGLWTRHQHHLGLVRKADSSGPSQNS